jgi:hypothetical protein
VNAIAAECYRIGNARGAFAQGMTISEIDAAESALGILFAVDHRDLLLLGVPIDGPDWRNPESAEVAKSLSAPAEGALHDVRINALWPASWGRRPADELSAESIAAIKIAEMAPDGAVLASSPHSRRSAERRTSVLDHADRLRPLRRKFGRLVAHRVR